MYITETTENVKKIIEKIEQLNDVGKVKMILYIFGLLNNDQINSKNEPNPNLVEDNELVVFNMSMLGLPNNVCEIFLQYNLMLYNCLTNTKNVFIDNGNVIGIEYDDIELEITMF